MNNDDMLDALKKSLARVLPGAAAVFAGVMLMLGIGVTLLVEGPPLVRSFTADLPPPLRSLILLVALGLPLVILCWWGRKLMGYSISHITKTKGGS